MTKKARARQEKVWDRDAELVARRLGWRLPARIIKQHPEANHITAALNAGMPGWLKERLRTRAANDQMSMSEWSRQVVWEALTRPEKPGS